MKLLKSLNLEVLLQCIICTNYLHVVKNNLFIITSPPSNTFIYNSSVIWNSVKSISRIDDAATSVYMLKLKLKTYLLNKQLLGDAGNWVENNFILL